VNGRHCADHGEHPRGITDTKTFNQRINGGTWGAARSLYLPGRHRRIRAGVGRQWPGLRGCRAIVPASAATEIILDNAAVGASGGGRSFTGTWCASTAAGYYGTNSLYSCGSGTDTYTWTPTIPAAANYSVYVRWTTHVNRGTAVPIIVNHTGGQTARTYNEQTGGGVWVLHGTYSFNTGTGGYVYTTDASGQACADAVRFVPTP